LQLLSEHGMDAEKKSRIRRVHGTTWSGCLLWLLTPNELGELAPYTSYRSAFRALLPTLADPRVGAGWLATKTSNGGEAA
jgi:hypothetical protein